MAALRSTSLVPGGHKYSEQLPELPAGTKLPAPQPTHGVAGFQSTSEAPAAHKETKHYQVWRDAVAPMMAEPRTSVKHTNVFPDAF